MRCWLDAQQVIDVRREVLHVDAIGRVGGGPHGDAVVCDAAGAAHGQCGDAQGDDGGGDDFLDVNDALALPGSPSDPPAGPGAISDGPFIGARKPLARGESGATVRKRTTGRITTLKSWKVSRGCLGEKGGDASYESALSGADARRFILSINRIRRIEACGTSQNSVMTPASKATTMHNRAAASVTLAIAGP